MKPLWLFWCILHLVVHLNGSTWAFARMHGRGRKFILLHPATMQRLLIALIIFYVVSSAAVSPPVISPDFTANVTISNSSYVVSSTILYDYTGHRVYYLANNTVAYMFSDTRQWQSTPTFIFHFLPKFM